MLKRGFMEKKIIIILVFVLLVIFLLTGCVNNKQDDTETQDETGLEEKFSCEEILPLEDLEGLTPKYPIMQCLTVIGDKNSSS